MSTPAARIVPEGRLRLAKSPTSAIAAAAWRAQEAAGLKPDTGADFIIIAVEPGRGGDKLAGELERVARAHVAAPADA